MPSDLEKIRRVLDLARAKINQQEPNLALANLREIQRGIEEYSATPEWAEFSLLIAEAYCAKCATSQQATLTRRLSEFRGSIVRLLKWNFVCGSTSAISTCAYPADSARRGILYARKVIGPWLGVAELVAGSS